LEYNSYTPSIGLVFFLAPPTSVIPNNANSGKLRIVDGNSAFNRFVGVEFDNYVNEWDPNHSHIGIDVNSIILTTTTTWESSNGVLFNVTIVEAKSLINFKDNKPS